MILSLTSLIYNIKKWWAQSDLNTRSTPCKGVVIATRPWAHNENEFFASFKYFDFLVVMTNRHI